jgi:hypothetical protein
MGDKEVFALPPADLTIPDGHPVIEWFMMLDITTVLSLEVP